MAAVRAIELIVVIGTAIPRWESWCGPLVVENGPDHALPVHGLHQGGVKPRGRPWAEAGVPPPLTVSEEIRTRSVVASTALAGRCP